MKPTINEVLDYLDSYVAAFMDGHMPERGSEADCLLCQDDFPTTAHLSEHVREYHLIPSILFNALAFAPVSKFTMQVIAEIEAGQSHSAGTPFSIKHVKNEIRNCLNAFLDMRFGGLRP